VNNSTTDDLLYRSGVGMMMVNDNGLIFVADRSDMSGPAWQMPQGGIDDGETPSAAALRELAEEAGTDKLELIAETSNWLAYDFPADIKQQTWKRCYRGQRQKWFLFRFTGTDDDINLDAHNREFDSWKWIEPERVLELIVPFKRKLYEDVFDSFSDPLMRLQER
jgi:putative (di)nucleoside polyphosphate hydrolase